MHEDELRALLSFNIKRLRNRREWSQIKLAEQLGLSSNFLSEIETGKGWVSPLTLTKLAEALEVEVYELFMPAAPLGEEVKLVMDRFAKDVSAALDQSLSCSIQRYLSKTLKKSLEESLQNVCKQYFEDSQA